MLSFNRNIPQLSYSKVHIINVKTKSTYNSKSSGEKTGSCGFESGFLFNGVYLNLRHEYKGDTTPLFLHKIILESTEGFPCSQYSQAG